MVKSHKIILEGTCSAIAFSAGTTAALAQSADAGMSGGADIVVKATRREQKLQDVGLTVTALASRREFNAEDLAKSVPSLSYAPSPNATPVYTLRGVGFYESSIAAYPDVAVYIDQAPLVVPVMTSLTAFDLERVEVMKGSQGTLCRSNGRTLIDAMIGMKSYDGCKATVWDKSITNKYYWTNSTLSYETNIRYAGRPA